MKKRIDFHYRIGTKVVIINDSIHCKAEDKNIGPYLITEVFSLTEQSGFNAEQSMKELILGG